jgi:hypothetical protein
MSNDDLRTGLMRIHVKYIFTKKTVSFTYDSGIPPPRLRSSFSKRFYIKSNFAIKRTAHKVIENQATIQAEWFYEVQTNSQAIELFVLKSWLKGTF